MFGHPMFGNMQNDPFYGSMHQQHMEQMQRMQQMMGNPFGNFFGPSPMLGLTDGRQQAQNNMQMSPFGMFPGMQNMDSMFSQMRSDPNAQTFSQSSFVSYSNTGNGEPQYYQATTSSRQAGDLREERKAVRDSRTGVEKIAVGHHIKDKGHVVTRHRNRRTEEEGEDQDYINLDEEELPHFDREFQERSHRMGRHAAVGGRRRERPLAVDYRDRRH